jgi:hypothetical protein
MGLNEVDQAPTEVDAPEAGVVAPTLWIFWEIAGRWAGIHTRLPFFWGQAMHMIGSGRLHSNCGIAWAAGRESDLTVDVEAVRPAEGSTSLLLPPSQGPKKPIRSGAESIC